MKCPVCVDVTLAISSREGIEIDHCPQCRGVWLDRGELDKIIERAAPSVVGGDWSQPNPVQSVSAPPPPGPPFQREPYGYYRDPYARPGKRKKRSFLEDLFDFD
ncbi:MAG: zf-TFIIB domain-containing protein [Acidimicrobiales bacterium]|nr:zf-TFIIB domain-containing protein [Acidimicrobiales bacterium]